MTNMTVRALAFALAAIICFAEGHAQTYGEPAGQADDRPLCAQQEPAHEAFQACTRLLLAGNFEPGERVRVVELRGRAALNLFDFSGAVEDFSDVLQREPENTGALILRAKAFSYQNEHAEAAEDLQRAVALKPDDVAARVELGTQLNHAGQYDKAAEALGEAVKRDAKNQLAFTGLAKALDMIGDIARADDSIAAALALNPTSYPALMVKAEMAERRGNTAQAIETYLLAVKSNGMQVKPRRALQRLGIETPTPP